MKNWVRVLALSLALVMVLGVSSAFADAYTIPKTLKNVEGLPENPEVPEMTTKNDGKTETVTVNGQLASLSAVWGDATAPLTLTDGVATFDITGHGVQLGMEGKFARYCDDWSYYVDRDYYNENKGESWQNNFYKWAGSSSGFHVQNTFSPLTYEGSGYLVRTPFANTWEDEDGEIVKDWGFDETYVGSEISDEKQAKLAEGLEKTIAAVEEELDEELPEAEWFVVPCEDGIIQMNVRNEWFSFWADDINGYGKAFEGKTADGVTVGYNRKGAACEKTIEMPAGTDFFSSETAPSKVTVTWQSGKNMYNNTVWYISKIAQEYADQTVTASFGQGGQWNGIKKEAKAQ